LEIAMKRTLFAAALGAAATLALAQGPGYGPGMMGGYGYGPGGYGPGMMRGYGYGSGMMGGGYGSLSALNLTSEQTDKVLAIQEENRSRNWGTMGEMRTEMFKLRQMYYSDKLDANAYADQQKKVDELRRQILKSQLEARKQIEAILTPEQRKQFRQFGPPWLDDEAG
jgi:Spy/CpxP family protein refolding chaperone